MRNREKYRRTFSALHTSKDYLTEVREMKRESRFHISKAMVICAAVILIMGLSAVAYAANIGGIQKTIRLWIRGEQKNAVFESPGDGSYKLTYEDEDGKIREQGGGGVAIEDDGTERPLTEEELMEDINAPEVIYEEDGSIWLYYFDQKAEITDEFGEDGICRVQLTDGKDTLYLTIRDGEGYSMSTNHCPDPENFKKID